MIKQSAESWLLGSEYVIIRIGRKKGWICYLVILTWPSCASVEERLNDKRFILQNEEPMVLMPNGDYEPANIDGSAYYFARNELKIMNLRLKERDAPLFSPDKFENADAVWTFLKKYSKSDN